jgi:hypothetical protein
MNAVFISAHNHHTSRCLALQGAPHFTAIIEQRRPPHQPFTSLSLVLASAFLYPHSRHLDIWVCPAAFHTLLDLACLFFLRLLFGWALPFFIVSPVHDTPHHPTLLVYSAISFCYSTGAPFWRLPNLFLIIIIVGPHQRRGESTSTERCTYARTCFLVLHFGWNMGFAGWVGQGWAKLMP